MEKEKVKSLIEKAENIGLKGVLMLEAWGVDEICLEYNGIGPAFLPSKLREKVTKLLGIFEPAAMIHDLRFGRSDGSRLKFDQANDEFFLNCRECAKAAYGWWNWRRYRAYAVAGLMHEFNCGNPGWKAWMDAYENNKHKER